MQIQLHFSGKNIRLPLAYNYPLQGLLYHALASRPELADFLHGGGYAWGTGAYKLFVFGPPSGRHCVCGKQLIFPDGFSLEVRSIRPEIIRALAAGLPVGKTVQLYDNPLTVRQSVLRDERVLAPQVDIELLSPVVTKRRSEGKTVYFAPSDPEFAQLININLRAKYAACHGRESTDSVYISAIRDERRMVTVFKHGLLINAFWGRMTLSGRPELLDLLYQTGLGAKNAQGFGLFRLL